MSNVDFRQFGKGYKKGGGFDMRTKQGREMQANYDGCVSAIFSLPFRLLGGIISLAFNLFKWIMLIVLWPITLPVWLIRRNRK